MIVKMWFLCVNKWLLSFAVKLRLKSKDSALYILESGAVDQQRTRLYLGSQICPIAIRV